MQDNPFAGGQTAPGYGNASVQLGGAPAAPAAASLIKDTTTATFQADVIAESRNQPVLVDFWAPWCGPCKQLTPVIEGAVQAAGGKVKLVKMNIDEHPAIAGQMGIQSIPAVVAFVNGQPIDGFMGAKPAGEVKAFIDKLAANAGGAAAEAEAQAIEQALAQAKQAAGKGDINAAAQIYSMILERDADNGDAYGAMAQLLADSGQPDQARAMIAQAPQSMANHPALTGVTAALDLAEKVAGLGDRGALEERLASDENDHEARFDLAQIMNAGGDRTGAADALLEIMRRDREWREDGARKELLIFFEAWGPTDPATLAARRKLSSLLFR